MRALVFASILVLANSACAPNGLAQLARSGKNGELASRLAERQQRGDLGDNELRNVARGVLEFGVSTQDETSARAFFDSIDRCVPRLERSILSKIEKRDGAHDTALFALATHDLLSNGEAASNGAFDPATRRAIAARVRVHRSDAVARREALQDSSVLVREQAIEASLRAADTGDLELLLERVRLDPDARVRRRALDVARTTARTLASTDVPRFLERLEDAAGRDSLLEDALARILAASPFYEHGGSRTLGTWVGGSSSRSFRSAVALLDAAPRNEPGDVSLRASALSVIRARLKTESGEGLLDTVRSLPPLDAFPEELSALVRHESLTVRANVFVQLLRSPQFEAEAVRELFAFAANSEHPEPKAIATFALVTRGDQRALPFAERDVMAPLPGRRIAAARALVLLGRSSRAASLLTDRDASVRNAVACVMLAEERGAAR